MRYSILVVVLALLVVGGLSLPAAQAQTVENAVLITVLGGWTAPQLQGFDGRMSGYTFGLSIDKLVGRHFTVGVGVDYGVSDQEFDDQETGEPRRASLSAPSADFTMKLIVGGKKLVAFVGAGVAAHWGTLKKTTVNGTVLGETTSSEWSIQAPAGIALFFNDQTYVSVGYELTYIKDSPWVEEYNHAVKIGLGIQLY